MKSRAFPQRKSVSSLSTMDVKAVLFVFLSLLYFRTADLAKLPPRHHIHAKHHAHTEKCHPLPPQYLANDDDNSSNSDESDSSPDNEVALDPTYWPPFRYPDHFLDNEAEPPFFENGPPPDVDFIGVKHHYSNATNLAFPAYANGQGRHKGKKRSKNGPKNFERHHSRKGSKKIKKSPQRHPGR